MKRKIIKIDEKLCTGCALCIPNCPEGAIQIIDGKARLVSDLFCDGLGACLGHCPEGAITVEEREAEAYDEKRVMENIILQGDGTIRAHLKHLQEHNEIEYLKDALKVLETRGLADSYREFVPKPALSRQEIASFQGCPGARSREFQAEGKTVSPMDDATSLDSELTQWPVQLKLISPAAAYWKDADILIAADCVPFAYGDFHRRYLKGKKLIIFCPKLDTGLEEYVDKLTAIFSGNSIRSLTILHMEVPCCFGVRRIVDVAMERAGKSIPVADITVSINGDVID